MDGPNQVQSIFWINQLNNKIKPHLSNTNPYPINMKFFALTLLLCVLTFALVYAVPIDESLNGDNFYESLASEDVHSPHDPQSIFKLKKLLKFKKLLG